MDLSSDCIPPLPENFSTNLPDDWNWLREKSEAAHKRLRTKIKLIHDLSARFAILYLKKTPITFQRIINAATIALIAASDARAFPGKMEPLLWKQAEYALGELDAEFFDLLREHPCAIWNCDHPMGQLFHSMDVSSMTQFKEFMLQAEQFQFPFYYCKFPRKAVIAASAIRLLVEEVSPGVQTKVDFFLKNGFPIRGDK